MGIVPNRGIFLASCSCSLYALCMGIIETFDKWATDGTLILVGGLTLVGVFIACFFLRTFWGQWDNRARQDEIYGKPGENLKEKKHLNHQER